MPTLAYSPLDDALDTLPPYGAEFTNISTE